MPRLYRRLFIAAVVIAFLAALCWLLLPRIGVDIPWWIPVIGFIVIVLSALLAPGMSKDQDDEDPDGPIPFRPPDEDEGEGVSAADRERFG
jgi:hypothetical protein